MSYQRQFQQNYSFEYEFSADLFRASDEAAQCHATLSELNKDLAKRLKEFMDKPR